MKRRTASFCLLLFPFFLLLAGCLGGKADELSPPLPLVVETAIYEIRDADGEFVARVKVAFSWEGGSILSFVNRTEADGPAADFHGTLVAKASIVMSEGTLFDLFAPHGNFFHNWQSVGFGEPPNPSSNQSVRILMKPWGVRSQMPTADAAIFTQTAHQGLDMTYASMLIGPQVAILARDPKVLNDELEWGDIHVNYEVGPSGWSLDATGPCQSFCGFPAPMVHTLTMEGDGLGMLPIQATMGIQGWPDHLQWTALNRTLGDPQKTLPDFHPPSTVWDFRPSPVCGLAPCEKPITRERFSLQAYLDVLESSPQWMLWAQENPEHFPLSFIISSNFPSTAVLGTPLPEPDADQAIFRFASKAGGGAVWFILDGIRHPLQEEESSPTRVLEPSSPMESGPVPQAYGPQSVSSELMSLPETWTLISLQGEQSPAEFDGVVLNFEPLKFFPHPREATTWLLGFEQPDGGYVLLIGSAYDGWLLVRYDVPASVVNASKTDDSLPLFSDTAMNLISSFNPFPLPANTPR